MYNFNVSFSTHKSEILLHLSQWQYWWWFWFSFFWTFYFFVILRVIKHRVFKMGLRLNTSLRSRGKWGDYLVTLIPISWCFNILLNSNFILRMIEWQAESGTLTIRIHGKQWYWVYKYDLQNVHTIFNTPKNLGKKRWLNTHPEGNTTANTYSQLTYLKLKNISEKEYWDEALIKEFNPTSTFSKQQNVRKNNTIQPVNFIKNKKPSFLIDQKIQTPSTNRLILECKMPEALTSLYGDYKPHNITLPNLPKKLDNKIVLFSENNAEDLNISFFEPIEVSKNKQNIKFRAQTMQFFDNIAVEDDWEVYSNIRILESETPVRLLKTVLNQINKQTTANSKLFKFKFNDSNESIVEKPEENIDFLVIKQKRYKIKQSIKPLKVVDVTTSDIQHEWKTSRFLKNNLIFKQIGDLQSHEAFNLYSSIRLNRTRSEMFSVNLARRLLRTTRTLVLPAYTNISIIANSYDVVHSWFIPGLGIKIDCVPGKSTHHSLYIDNVGLYYGQCAEICGRYHHHMPIRICAIPFDHFIVWWTAKGLPKILKMRYNLKKLDEGLLAKYVW